MKFRNNQAVKVLHGYYRGAVGIVEDVREGAGETEYEIKVDGIVNGDPVTKKEWLTEDYLSVDLSAEVG